MKTAIVMGAGGFIGSHLCTRLRSEGYYVRGVDLKYPEFGKTSANDFVIADLRQPDRVDSVIRLEKVGGVVLPYAYNLTAHAERGTFDEVYQLAADMGGAGFVFTGNHDADIMHNSAMINLNVANAAVKYGVRKLFYSSSACMYPAYNQEDPENPKCSEDSAYPAAPDSEYGWEKLFSERLYLAYKRNFNLNVKIARFHNIFGPMGTYKGGREKAPAAMCRKVIEAAQSGTNTVDVWGSGRQTRSFLYIDDCINAVRSLMESDFSGPVNIGSEEMITINGLAKMVSEISGAPIQIKNIDGPVGVNGRNSDNTLIREKLGWEPTYSLREGMQKTFYWILNQIV